MLLIDPNISYNLYRSLDYTWITQELERKLQKNDDVCTRLALASSGSSLCPHGQNLQNILEDKKELAMDH
jgi:hypothetical protein